jgi:GDPmannose 4,6-dehydratase
MQWLMLQQDRAEDYVIASGQQYSVREFVSCAAREIGIDIRWEGDGVEEIGVVESFAGSGGKVEPGRVIVRVDPRYFRPTEVETLLGDASKARRMLGWEPKITFQELVREMIREDLTSAEKDTLVRQHGFTTYDYHE